MDELEKRLQCLTIGVAEQKDGKIAVFTTVEPLFCFVRDNEAQAFQIAQETLASYAKNFYDVNLDVELVGEPVKPVREVLLEPRRRARPTLSINRNAAYA